MIEYKAGSTLEKILEAGKFAVTAELGPPKSADTVAVKKKAEHLRGNVDGVNITDNQTAIVRMSSFAAGLIVMQLGMEPVIQIGCRDRNRIAIQSDVLGAAALGIKNILCITGDHQSFGNHATGKNVYDMDSIQLVDLLKHMRDNKVFLCGEEIKNSKKAPIVEPRIYIGAAANPFADPFAFRVIRLAKKAKAGADFVQTQCVYDMERFKKWMEQVRERELHKRVKILPGVTPFKSARMAQYMRDSVAGVTVPDYYIDRLSKAEDPKEEGIHICIEQIKQLQEIEGVAGVHIMAIEWERKVGQIVEGAGLLPRPSFDSEE